MELIRAVTKTIKVIANTTIVDGELAYFPLYFTNDTYLDCYVTFNETRYGRALELLSASMHDNTYAKIVSNVLGFPLTVEWRMGWYQKDVITLYLNEESEEPTPVGKDDRRDFIHSTLSHLINSTLFSSTCLFYSTLLYS